MTTTSTFQQNITVANVSTQLSTGLNSLANNSLAVSAAFTPSNKQRRALVEFAGSFPSAPTANTGMALWCLKSIDGTVYEDGGSGVTPARNPDQVFPVRAVTTAQVITRHVTLPSGTCKLLLKNDGTGQALASSGNTLRILEIDDQIVT